MTTIYEQLGITAQEFLDQHDLALEFGSGKAVWVRKEEDRLQQAATNAAEERRQKRINRLQREDEEASD